MCTSLSCLDEALSKTQARENRRDGSSPAFPIMNFPKLMVSRPTLHMSCTLLNSKPSHGAAIAPTTTVIGDTVYATNSAALCGRLAGEAPL